MRHQKIEKAEEARIAGKKSRIPALQEQEPKIVATGKLIFNKKTREAVFEKEAALDHYKNLKKRMQSIKIVSHRPAWTG